MHVAWGEQGGAWYWNSVGRQPERVCNGSCPSVTVSPDKMAHLGHSIGTTCVGVASRGLGTRTSRPLGAVCGSDVDVGSSGVNQVACRDSGWVHHRTGDRLGFNPVALSMPVGDVYGTPAAQGRFAPC